MSDFEDEVSFGRMAVKMGFCSKEQVEKAVAEQRRAEIGGAFDHLGTIMLREGVLTEKQIEEVLELQKEMLGKERIGGYELVRELGRGAAGVVYLARQLALDREVALKVIPKGHASNREFRARFLREARVAAQLSHPNIIKAIDAGESQSAMFFAMELFLAPDLSKILKRRGCLREEEVVRIGLQVARALEHAHENRLVHRDIKPENLLMREDTGLVKLTDLGLARSTSNEGKHLTKTGMTMGTPYYMSPEAVKGSLDIDIRADLYSLGATLYHLAVGRPPFEADTVFQVLRMHLDATLIPPRHARPELSEAFSRIVVKAMRKDPDKRYQSPAEMLEDLARLERLGPKAVLKEDRGKASTRIKGKRRSFPVLPLLAAAAGLALIAAVAAFVASQSGGGKTREPPPKPDEPPRAASGPSGNREPSTPGEKPLPSLPDEKELSQKAFEAAAEFARRNPEKPEEAIEKFEEVAEKHPSLAGKCREEIARWSSRTLEARLQAMNAEVAALEAEKKFGPALRLLDAFPLSQQVPPDVAALLEKRSAELMTRAQSEARLKEARARAMLNRGELDRAVALVEELRVMDVPTLNMKVESLVREFRAEAERLARLRSHLVLLEKASEKGLSAALAAARESPFAELDAPLFEEAAALLDRAVEGAGRFEGKTARVRLRTGALLDLKLSGATPEKLFGFSGGSDPVERLWRDLSLETVLDFAGSAGSPLARARLAWCLHRDADSALGYLGDVSQAPPGPETALADLVLGAVGLWLDSGIGKAEELLEEGQRKKAADLVLELLNGFRGLGPLSAREGKLRELLGRTGGDRLGAMAPFLFRGRAVSSGAGLEVSYGFQRAVELEDFECTGPPLVHSGGCAVQRDADPIDAAARLSGLWAEGRIGALFRLEEGGAFALEAVPASGASPVFLVRRTGDACEGGFTIRDAEGNWKPAGKQKKARWTSAAEEVEFLFSGGSLTVNFMNATFTTQPGQGPFAVALRSLGRFELDELKVSGRPDGAWLEGVALVEGARGRLMSGEAVDVGAEMPFSTWRSSKGTLSVNKGVFSLDTRGSLARAWHPEGTRLVSSGRDLTITVEARRLSDAGCFVITFPLDGRFIAWLFLPERDEARPADVPEDYAICSRVPFSDGAFHALRIELRGKEALLYVDGMVREIFGLDDLKGLETGAFMPSGLGFSAADGRWEVGSFRVRRTG